MRDYRAAKANGGDATSEILAVASSADALSDFDMSFVDEKKADILAVVEEAKTEIAASDTRLKMVQKYAKTVDDAPDNRVDKATVLGIRKALAALTALDRYRITDAQRAAVTRVCAGGPLPDSANLAPALKGHICD